ncbi:GDP-L-galactose phosphorylase 1, partial [Tanacetum coccineum]
MEKQCYAEKQALGEVSAELLDTQVNPAVWEISGHMVLKRKEDFDGATEANAWRLLAEVSLSEERFQEVMAIIFEAISCVVIETTSLPDEDEQDDVEDVDPLNNGSHQAAIVAGKQECLVYVWTW